MHAGATEKTMEKIYPRLPPNRRKMRKQQLSGRLGVFKNKKQVAKR